MAVELTLDEQLEPAYFFLMQPLYSEVMVDLKRNRHIWYLKQSPDAIRFDGYEIFSKKETTFSWQGALPLSTIGKCVYTKHQISCTRTGTIYFFVVRFDAQTGSLMKVGQYPTVADLHLYELKEYAGVLPKDKREEIARAIGLAAHGIGIGSFVYLRRVFEHLIVECFTEHRGQIDPDGFLKARMDERIEMLQDYLPPFLVEHRAIYGMLSAGVHELTENDCLAHFDALRTGIEIILDQKVEEKKKTLRLKEASDRLIQAKSAIMKAQGPKG
jgi:hypothetical protein